MAKVKQLNEPVIEVKEPIKEPIIEHKLEDEPIIACKEYRPDHNGECLNCDEPYDAHEHL